MKSAQTPNANAELQATLQSFMSSMSDGQGHVKKVKLTTVNPETGQPLTVEMEQSTVPQYQVQPQVVVSSVATSSTAVTTAPQSILAQALPGGSIIEKLIGGHISYLIIPMAGMVIAWSYSQIGSAHSSLGVAINLFLLSIIFELTAKFMSFPVVEAALDKKLETQRIRLKTKRWYQEWIKDVADNLKSGHIKKGLQWSGIAFAFMGCFVMLAYFIYGAGQALSPTVGGSIYSTNVSQDQFMVR